MTTLGLTLCALLAGCGDGGEPEDNNATLANASASSASALPASAKTWTQCAAEGLANDTCVVPSPREVRYGVPGAYTTKLVERSIKCNDGAFGVTVATPYQNFCEYVVSAASAPTPAPAAPAAPAPAAPAPAPAAAPAPAPAAAPSSGGTAGPRVSSFTASGAITATSGQVIAGVRIQNANGPCVYIPPGVTGVVVRDSDIGPCGGNGSIVVNGSGATIEHNYVHEGTRGVYVGNTSNVTIRKNKIHGPFRGLSCGHPTNADFCSHNLEFADVSASTADGNEIRGTMATDAVSMWQSSGMRLINNDIDVTITHIHAASFTMGDSLSGNPGRDNYIAGNVVRQRGMPGGARGGVFGSAGNTVFERNCFVNGMTVMNYSGIFNGIVIRNNVINMAESILPDVALVSGWNQNVNSSDCSLMPSAA